MQLSRNCFTIGTNFCPKHLLKSCLLTLSAGLEDLNHSKKQTLFVIGIKCFLIVSYFPYASVKHSKADFISVILKQFKIK